MAAAARHARPLPRRTGSRRREGGVKGRGLESWAEGGRAAAVGIGGWRVRGECRSGGEGEVLLGEGGDGELVFCFFMYSFSATGLIWA